MNRLWVRMSLFFSLAIVGGVMSLIWLPRTIFNTDIPPNALLLNLLESGDLERRIASLIADEGYWEEALRLIKRVDAYIPRGIFGQSYILILADSEGRLIYSSFDQYFATSLSVEERQNAAPIYAEDGRLLGYLDLRGSKIELPANNGGILIGELLNGIVVVGAAIGGVGLVLGVLVSRQLSEPLSQLAQSARSFQRNREQRAVLRGTEEARDLARAFNEMADALNEADTLRRHLVADVAHELRTPLSVLQANLQAILDGVYPLEKAEIQALYDQSALLNRLVNDLHELAQAEAHHLPLHSAPLDLVELVQSASEAFTVLAENRQVNLHTSLPPTACPYHGDAERLRQVLHNLLQNALAHVAPGGHVALSLAGAGQAYIITVRDDGAGIAREDLPRVFERFYRGDGSRSRHSGGAGLGLAIAKAIVELHGGRLEAESEGPGQGASFRIVL